MRQGTIIVSAIAGGMALLFAAGMAALVGVAILTDGNERIRISVGELYYTNNVEQEQAERLAGFLDAQFSDLENFITFQLDRRQDAFVVRMCAQPQAWESDDLDYSFVAMEILLQQEVFSADNVVFEVCDEHMKTRKTFDRFEPNS